MSWSIQRIGHALTGAELQRSPRLDLTIVRSGNALRGAVFARVAPTPLVIAEIDNTLYEFEVLEGAGQIVFTAEGLLEEFERLEGSGQIILIGAGQVQEHEAAEGSGHVITNGAGEILETEQLDGVGQIVHIGAGIVQEHEQLDGSGQILTIGAGIVQEHENAQGGGQLIIIGSGEIQEHEAAEGVGEVVGGGGGGPTYDADAQAWFDAVELAGGTFGDGSYSEATVKQAVSDLVAGARADGEWDDIVYLHLLCAVNEFAQLTIPLKTPASAPAFSNFVSGDYTATGSGAGLSNLSGGRHINSHVSTNDLGQDAWGGAYITQRTSPQADSAPSFWGTSTFAFRLFTGPTLALSLRHLRTNGNSAFIAGDNSWDVGFLEAWGNATNYAVRRNEAGGVTGASSGPLATDNGAIHLFSRDGTTQNVRMRATAFVFGTQHCPGFAARLNTFMVAIGASKYTSP